MFQIKKNIIKFRTAMEPVSLCELKADGFKKFLDSFDYVFSDCDGVIWSEAGPYPDAGRFFELIQKLGKRVHYVSNNSLRSKDMYNSKFASVGIENGCDNITVPSIALGEYLKAANLKKKAYCVTCTETVKVLQSYGIECAVGPDVLPDNYIEYIHFLKDDEEIGAVVFDSDFKVNLGKMYKATTYLKRPEVLFVNGATDRTIPLKPGLTTIGPGAFSDIVAEMVKRTPIQLAKPGKEFGDFVMKRAGVTDPSRVLFIGDMIDQDVGLGKAMGFKTFLVLNTVSKEDMMSHPTIKPDYYAKDLASIMPLLSAVADK